MLLEFLTSLFNFHIFQATTTNLINERDQEIANIAKCVL